MLTEDGHPNNDYYEEDGLHVSGAGYEVWKQILLTRIFSKDTKRPD